MTPFNEIIQYFNFAQKLAIEEFERIVTDIVEEDPKITGFISAMGVIKFYDEYDESVGIDDIKSTPNTVSLSNMIQEWDNTFGFSGHPFRLKYDSSEQLIVIRNW